MNITLTEDESSSDDQNENSYTDEGLDFMAFNFVVKRESINKIKRVDDIEQSDSSLEK